MRLGSLFSGYGGLDLAVSSTLGTTTAWVSDIDKGACKILAHRYPDVPNLGDITAVDWSRVEPVDVLTGGFPCQDLSHAGKRAGLRPDTRSGLWTHMAYAIDQLRPRLVVAENVRGLLSAPAHSDVEPCPWCVGDRPGGYLRALGAVLGDLADLGYDASWYGLRAADVGACHGRFRVFLVAYPRYGASDRERARTEPKRRAATDANLVGHQRARGARGRRGRPTDRGSEPLIPTPRATRGGSATETVSLLPTPLTTTADGVQELERATGGRGSLLPTPGASAGEKGRATGQDPAPRRLAGKQVELADIACYESDEVNFGQYAAAIRRHEQVLGRAAASPTEPTGRGNQRRLSARFVEFMMMLPEGWVTDVPGLTRNEQLKALGNGVLPLQAETALRILLGSLEAVA